MKIFKSKAFLGVVCIIAAAAVAFLLLPQLYAARSSVTNVVQATADIPAGTVITEDMITLSEVGSYGLPGKVVLNKDDAVGKVAAEPLYRGEYLWSSRLSDAEAYEAMENEQTKGLTDGNCLVMIELPKTSAAVASVLRAGGIVDAYECTEQQDGSVSAAKIIPSLHVYDIVNQRLESLDELDKRKKEAENDNTSYDFEPKYIVFRCTEQQAQTLMQLEREEALHLTLRGTEG